MSEIIWINGKAYVEESFYDTGTLVQLSDYQVWMLNEEGLING